MTPGPVLDAACGTGRHTAYLVGAGREVMGVDASEPMLARARRRLPEADLRVGELTRLPLEAESVAGAVCALALSHLADIAPAIAELGRVLALRGRLIVSDPHPLASGVLGWRRSTPIGRANGEWSPNIHTCTVSTSMRSARPAWWFAG